MAFQLGIDVGGTFTDLVIGNGDGQVFKTKSPSTPGDESVGIHQRAPRRRRALRPSDLPSFLGRHRRDRARHDGRHQRDAGVQTGPTPGLITTGGFRDIIELRRSYREHLFDIRLPAPHPIVPRQKRLGRHRADRLPGPDRDPARRGRASRAAVERPGRARGRVGRRLPAVLVPESRRTSSACASSSPSEHPGRPGHALVRGAAAGARVRAPEHDDGQRVHAPEDRAVPARLERAGCADEGFARRAVRDALQRRHGRRRTTRPSTRSSCCSPGPPAASWPARRYSALSGYRDVITVDMGGTSYDVCLVKDSRAGERHRGSGSAATASAPPMVDVHTVGAGGGSIAWIDDGGALRVGPAERGRRPGPSATGAAAPSRRSPTPTSCSATSARTTSSAAGCSSTSTPRGRDRREDRASRSGMDAIEAASGIFRIVEQQHGQRDPARHRRARPRSARLRPVRVRRRRARSTPGRRRRTSGSRRSWCPKAASVLSALGNQMANFKITKVQSFIRAHRPDRPRGAQRGLRRDARARRSATSAARRRSARRSASATWTSATRARPTRSRCRSARGPGA